ncbi:MAG: SIS domain-containing protein [Candidatus Kerfeldbacteria bacterium]
MSSLDNLKNIIKLDKQGMAGSIESLGLQCQQAWEEANKIKIPNSYKSCKNIVISGMGGSALGGHVIESLYSNDLKVPFRVTNSYFVPGSVDKNTLYILSSYSGTTEEILATLPIAKKRKAKLLIICAGGKLSKAAKKYKIPAYIFDPKFNPSNQPRMGLGYSIVGQIALLKNCGMLKVTDNDFKKVINLIVKLHNKFGLKVPSKKNKAKQMAIKLYGRLPINIAAEHLAGNVHIMTNQINENSKTFSAYFLISELNHHLMEGLIFPKTNKSNLVFTFLESKLYPAKITIRVAITKKVLDKSKIPYIGYMVSSKDKLSQSFEALLFGSYVNFYMSMLNNIDPSPIPVVDFFKQQLAK